MLIFDVVSQSSIESYKKIKDDNSIFGTQMKI